MAPARERKTSKGRVKQDPATTTCNANTNAIRTGHVVCVTSVPSTLCASERTVRDFFAEYGKLLSVTIHHNFLDMEPDGFVYLEYSEKEEAEDALAAVKEKRVGTDAKFERTVFPSEMAGMNAAMALCRGEPKLEVDEEMKDIFLGRQELNRFTQSHFADENDAILQSLSQHSFTNSQLKKGKKRRQKHDGVPLKKAKMTRLNKGIVPTE